VPLLCPFGFLATGAVLGFLFGCAPGVPDEAGSQRIKVAAAANLSRAFPAVAEAFTAETGVDVVLTFGATAYLAHQIESGAPFDLYAAADTEHVDRLVLKGLIAPESRAVYARGRLVLWAGDDQVTAIGDLTGERVRFVALAKPEIAPYGRAAVEALKRLEVWNSIQPKIVYAQNVTMAKQLVDSGNAEAAFVSASLLEDASAEVAVDSTLYAPIEQGLGVVAGSAGRREAAQFAEFLLGANGRVLLGRFGYGAP
jgi:molybdate transport system substrate-binding protein